MTVVTEPMVTASPAVLLREAASRMRELAQAATPGPWIGHRIGLMGGRIGVVVAQPPPHGAFVMVDRDNETRTEDAAHVAAWHPAVALAVANWLDVIAQRVNSIASSLPSNDPDRDEIAARNILGYAEALNVARVFLGTDR